MFSIFHKANDVWEAQLKDIEEATKSIYLEQYIVNNFGEGEIGRRFMDVLIRKAREGLEVELIIDAQGSFALFSSIALNNAFTEAGGKTYYYKTQRISPTLNPFRILLRDHRKLLLVDGRITWLGGVVVGERYRDWEDFMVRYDDTGVTTVLEKEFVRQIRRIEEHRSLLAPVETIAPGTHIIGNAPGVGNRFCYEEICHAIMLAQKSVVLVTPYFAPPLKLLRVLNRRLDEGLSITLLIPRETDNHIADCVREQYLPKLVERGLILNYSSTMNHSKVILIDGDWMTFGSTNLDPLSLTFNHELNITTTDPAIIGEVEKVVAAWRKGLEPVTKDCCEYGRFPFAKKVLGWIVRGIIRMTSH